jgi:hypothetical protein
MKGLIAGVVSIMLAMSVTSTQAVSGDELMSAAMAAAEPTEMAPAASTSGTNQEQVLLEFDVYRICGNISFESEYLEVTKAGKEGVAKELMSFTRAKLTVAGVELLADEGGWTWVGKDRPPEGSRIEVIASPKLLVLFDQSFVVEIGSEQPIEYFEKRPDGLFELKKLHEKTGFTLSGKVERPGGEQIILRDLTIRLQSVEKRQPIEGASLDVGYPIVRTHESITTVAVKPGGYHGMLLGSEGYGSLLLRLRACLL